MTFVSTESGGLFGGWTFDRGEGAAATHLLLADPYTFPAGALLGHLNDLQPPPVVVGGLASGASGPGEAILFRDDEVLQEGAVGRAAPHPASRCARSCRRGAGRSGRRSS